MLRINRLCAFFDQNRLETEFNSIQASPSNAVISSNTNDNHSINVILVQNLGQACDFWVIVVGKGAVRIYTIVHAFVNNEINVFFVNLLGYLWTKWILLLNVSKNKKRDERSIELYTLPRNGQATSLVSPWLLHTQFPWFQTPFCLRCWTQN